MAHMYHPSTISFDDWKGFIQTARDVEELVRLMREYLGQWRPEELRFLPWDLGATALANSEDIVSRALLASRAELKFSGSEDEHRLLREMALTLTAAATRLRFLKAPGSPRP